MSHVRLRCAIYTRKSTEEGLDQSFNSLDAQREACAAFILSQKSQGWQVVQELYDDPGYSGGTLERPALQRLLAEIEARRINVVVVYKVDRLTRSLTDFAKLVERFDAHQVSFVSVTQQFNTTSSMGRLTLNVLLSFAQFEREVTGERIRDKIAASKRKGLWMGGIAPIGYVASGRSLAIDEPEAARVREIFSLYESFGCVRRLKHELDHRGWKTLPRATRRAGSGGGRRFSRGHLYRILTNPIYLGEIRHKEFRHPGQHAPIIDRAMWEAVQARLAANRNGRKTRAYVRDPSVLAGILFDENERPLIAMHAKKGSRRYRYYVSQHLVHGGEDQSGRGMRIPAAELEDLVSRGLIAFLSDQSRILAAFPASDAVTSQQRLRAAQRLSRQLQSPAGGADGPSAGARVQEFDQSKPVRVKCVRDLVKRLFLTDAAIRIDVRLAAIDPCASGALAHDATLTITLPVERRRCGLGIRLIVKPPHALPPREPDPRLVAILVKANDWFARLRTGDAQGIRSIAKAENVSSSYVVRVVQLAFLAPEIAFAIAGGQQPPTLTAQRLMRSVPLPLAWPEQRIKLGFAEDTR